MASVTYIGSREELQGQKFDVPEAVLTKASGNSVALFIERQVDDKAAIDAAEQEATTRRQQSLAARMEQERVEVEATIEATAQAEGQTTRDAEFRVELSDLSLSVQQAGAAIVGKAEAIEAAYGQWSDRHETVVTASEAAVERANTQVTFAQAVSQEADDALKTHIQSQEQRISSLEEELRNTVLQLQGPQGERGERGMPGSGVVKIGEDPRLTDIESLGRKWFGRRVVPGDQVRWSQADGARIFRCADGKTWDEVDFEANVQELVSSRLNVLDQSTKSTNITTNIKTGGGGGGLERFQVAQVNPGTMKVADSGGWVVGTATSSNPQDPESGILEVELLPVGGGESYRFSSVFKWDAATAAVGGLETTSAILGQLPTGANYEILISRGSVVVPGGITTTAPAGALCTVVQLKITGSESYMLRGGIEWLMSSEPKVLGARDVAQQPSWRFS